MAVRNWEKSWDWSQGGPAAATACSGTDVMKVVCDEIAAELAEQMGIQAKVRFVAAAEIDPGKREFLIAQHSPSMLLRDNSELGKGRALNEISCRMELIPHFDVLGQGVVCKSATPLSSCRKANENCVASGEAATGRSFQECLAIVDEHNPFAFALECVKELARETADEQAVDKSDAEHMGRKLEERGYWVLIVEMEALDWGAPVRRRRLWWVGLRYIVGFTKEMIVPAKTFYTKMLNSFRCPQALLPGDCMQRSTSDRIAFADAHGLPVLAGTGLRLPLREKQDPDWKLDHMDIYEEQGLAWPVELATMSDAINVDGLTLREAELAFFCHTVFPRSAELADDVYEFMDIVPKKDRVLAGCFTLTKDPTPKAVPKGSGPWLTNCRTLTGSMKLMTRYISPEGKGVVRLVEAFECLAMMGWCGRTWSEEADPSWKDTMTKAIVEASPVTRGQHLSAEMQTHLAAELLSDMSGNAWSVWHIGPVWLALLATWGRYFVPTAAPT